MLLRRILLKFKTDFIAKAAVLGSGTAAAQITLIVASPILTRLYDPGDFGEYALFTGFSRLIAPIVTGQYESAIMLAANERESINIACIPISLPILLLSLAGAGFYFSMRYFSLISHTYFNFIELLLIGVLSTTTYETFYYLQLRREAYKNIAISKMIFSFTNVFLAVSTALYTSELTYKLVYAFLISKSISLLSLLIFFLKDNGTAISSVNLKSILTVARKYHKFPKYLAPQSLSDYFRANAINTIISSKYGVEMLGQYSLAQRIIQIPLSFLSASISQVFYQKSSKLMMESKSYYIARIARKITLNSLLYISIPLLSCSIFFPYGFQRVFGHEWRNAGYISLIIMPWLLVNFMSSCISTLPIVFNKQKNFFARSIIYNLLIPLTLLTATQFSKNIHIPLLMVSILGSIYLVYLIIWLLNKVIYLEI